MKLSRKLAVVTLLLIGIMLIFFIWHKQTLSIEAIWTSEINSLGLERKLLIATQGSPFKDSVAVGVLEHYKSRAVVVEVRDVAALENTDAADFDAILIMHRWEAGAPSETVQSFMVKNSGFADRIVVLTTSWNGLEKMEDVDAVTGASVLEDVPIFIDRITKKLKPLLKVRK